MTQLELAPYSDPRTSKAAAEAITPHLPALRAEVLSAIKLSRDGKTAEEIEIATGLRGSTVRPRLVELVKSGLAEKGIRTRKTRSGRAAAIYTATEAGRRA